MRVKLSIFNHELQWVIERDIGPALCIRGHYLADKAVIPTIMETSSSLWDIWEALNVTINSRDTQISVLDERLLASRPHAPTSSHPYNGIRLREQYAEITIQTQNSLGPRDEFRCVADHGTERWIDVARLLDVIAAEYQLRGRQKTSPEGEDKKVFTFWSF